MTIEGATNGETLSSMFDFSYQFLRTICMSRTEYSLYMKHRQFSEHVVILSVSGIECKAEIIDSLCTQKTMKQWTKHTNKRSYASFTAIARRYYVILLHWAWKNNSKWQQTCFCSDVSVTIRSRCLIRVETGHLKRAQPIENHISKTKVYTFWNY